MQKSNKIVDNKLDSITTQLVKKSESTMNGDLLMRGIAISRLPVEYPPTYTGDEAVSWQQAVRLVQDLVGNLPTKDYIDNNIHDLSTKE